MISHDKITSFLSEGDFTGQHLWRLTKSSVRRVGTKAGIILIDDIIGEKRFTDENELITWHFDHTLGRTVKGVNILSALYYSQEMLIPVGFQPVKNAEILIDKKTGQARKKAARTKNDYFRDLLIMLILNLNC